MNLLYFIAIIAIKFIFLWFGRSSSMNLLHFIAIKLIFLWFGRWSSMNLLHFITIKLIFLWFGRFWLAPDGSGWLRMAPDGSGWLWLALAGSGWLWLALAGQTIRFLFVKLLNYWFILARKGGTPLQGPWRSIYWFFVVFIIEKVILETKYWFVIVFYNRKGDFGGPNTDFSLFL